MTIIDNMKKMFAEYDADETMETHELVENLRKELFAEPKDVVISKNKMVLLSKLLKDVKNSYKELDGKELMVYKFTTQRKFIETIMESESLDKFIDSLKNRNYKLKLKEQISEVEE